MLSCSNLFSIIAESVKIKSAKMLDKDIRLCMSLCNTSTIGCSGDVDHIFFKFNSNLAGHGPNRYIFEEQKMLQICIL